MLLGIDVGTTAIKAALYDEAGRVKAEAQVVYATRRDGAAEEQDPAVWMAALERVLPPVLAHGEPAAMAVTGQMSGLLLAGEDLQPVFPFMPWSDRRAGTEAAWLADRLGAGQLYRTTGCRAAAGYPAAKLRWVQANRPDVWAQTRRVLGAREYVTARLTGAVVTDPSCAGTSQFFDISSQAWWGPVLAELGLAPEQLPELRLPWEKAGESRGVPVAVGAGDGACSSLGAGATAPGDAVISIGTSGVVRVLAAEPLIHPQAATTCYPLGPGLYAGTGVTSAAGAAMDWAARLLGIAGPSDLEGLAAQAPPGSRGLLFVPHLAGARTPYWDDSATGGFRGMTLAHDRSCLARSVIEGVALSVVQALEALVEIGARPARLLLTGGGSRSDVLAGTLAGLTGLPAFRAVGGGATLGAAQLAAVAGGIYPTLDAARAAMAPPLEPVTSIGQPDGLLERYRQAAAMRGD